jgi:hypothetical protein
MKHYVLTLILVALLNVAALAKEVEIPGIPSSAEQFTEMRDKLATTPEGGAAATVAALLAFSQSPEVGLQCLTLILDQRNVGNGTVIKGHAPISAIMYHVNRISGYDMWPYLGFAYLKGARAQSNYAVNPPYKVVTSRQKNSGTDSSGQVKVFVECDGFRPRPISLHRNDKGIWKAYEMSSLFLNVSPPASSKPVDDL